MFSFVNSRRYSDQIFSKRLWGFFIDFQLLIPSFFCSVALVISLSDSWYQRYKTFTTKCKERKRNAGKAKVRKFWYQLEYYCDYGYTCYFSGNCSTKHCHCSKSGQSYTDFWQCNAEVCENIDAIKEMMSEEDEDVDESFWTLVSRLATFNVFCNHITWQNYCFFLLTINFLLDVFSTGNTLYSVICI